jgi:hypothetical protein
VKHDLEYPQRIIRVIKSRAVRWAKHKARMDAYKIFVGIPERKTPRLSCEDGIKTGLKRWCMLN